MTRPDWHSYFLQIARAVSARASCSRRAVGCVLVDSHNVVIATGYNGAPSGARHCDHANGGDLELGHCVIAVHAEANALLTAASAGRRIRGAKCYVTTRPCRRCAAMLLQAGISEVHYQDDYEEPLPITFPISFRYPAKPQP